jgi:hypothetical protein
VQFQTAGPDVVRAISQRWLLKYWQDLRGKRVWPLWSQIGAADLKPVLDGVNFYDVVRENGGLRFLIRFQGRRITQAYGGDCSGKFFDEVLPPVVRDTTLTVYRHAVQHGEPVYTISQAHDHGGQPVQHERLVLPFSGDGRDVNHVLASIEMISAERRFEQQGLMRSQARAPDYLLCAAIAAPNGVRTPPAATPSSTPPPI